MFLLKCSLLACLIGLFPAHSAKPSSRSSTTSGGQSSNAEKNDGIGFVKAPNKIVQILKDKDFKFTAPFHLYMNELCGRIDASNKALADAKHQADIENDQFNARFYAKEIEPFEIDHPSEKFNIISRIYLTQYITICRFFLHKFLTINPENETQFGKIMKMLQSNQKVLDLVRFEKKLEQFDAILKSSKILIQKKLDFFGKECVKSKNYKLPYTNAQYLHSIELIEHELNNFDFIWLQDDASEGARHFWTVDKRPNVLQTLWVVRHAERRDVVDSKWGKDLDALARQDPPLSPRGIEQAKELGKWFEKLPISKVFASPFKRTLETSTLLLGERRSVHVNVEPGLGEFLKPCAVQLGFMQMPDLHKAFPLTDPNYLPVYSKKALETIVAEAERSKEKEDERKCHFMVEQTLRHILQQNKKAEHIVLVSHRDTIGHIHKLLGGEWAVVDQATVSKFVRYVAVDQLDILKQFVVEYSGNVPTFPTN
uniref:Histidine phosphatase family protein n=1 Tax=Globodera pallida TaxID=36090 RepID=A0A183BKE9_GLOPA